MIGTKITVGPNHAIKLNLPVAFTTAKAVNAAIIAPIMREIC